MLYAFWNMFADDFTSLVFYIGLTMTFILAHRTTTKVTSRFRAGDAMQWQHVCTLDSWQSHTPTTVCYSKPIVHWLARTTMRKDGPDDDGEAASCLYPDNQSIQQGGKTNCNAHLYPHSLKSTVLF
ncbi:hypothetical protein [Terribacillus saccharophilus]|uniref:Uncharacterized protein n=1 Tax=Terribacillus saccharophilus TaxID=361277 RepID=A0A075LFG4_9BACI|nr:hypothetical protein [Terribacillus goriensis]AIF65430.1 hypothetical protein GZ22_01320 [Terribacillus goriensis]MEC0284153.1 hypothetical protein [Terribacillus saccharophilus]MEC0289699.1 hypothetical protein [Terribacillus saccharophilus]